MEQSMQDERSTTTLYAKHRYGAFHWDLHGAERMDVQAEQRNKLPDNTLVGLTIQGDTDAFGILVNRYQGAVFATAYYYVGRHGAAEDIAQESFLSAYRSLRHLREAASFGPWLKEVTCRTAANWLRRNARRLEGETPLPHRQAIPLEDMRDGPAALAEKEDEHRKVRQAIEALPDNLRLPVILRYLQDLSYDEISAFTGESRDEVRGALARATRALRRLLSGESGQSKGENQWRRAIE